MKALLALVLSAGFSTAALSTPVTVNFDDGKFYGFNFYTECTDGVTPESQHPDFAPWPAFFEAKTNFLTTRICPHERDENSDDPITYIARNNGKPFTLLGFDTYDGSALIQSSKGGFFLTDFTYFGPSHDSNGDPIITPDTRLDPTYNFSGHDWNNVRWITLLASDGFDHGQAAFDDFRFDIRTVSEPAIGVANRWGARVFCHHTPKASLAIVNRSADRTRLRGGFSLRESHRVRSRAR